MEQEQEGDRERRQEERVRGNRDPEEVGGPAQELVPDRQHQERHGDRHPDQRVALDEPAAANQLEDDPEHDRGDDHGGDPHPVVEVAAGG